MLAYPFRFPPSLRLGLRARYRGFHSQSAMCQKSEPTPSPPANLRDNIFNRERAELKKHSTGTAGVYW